MFVDRRKAEELYQKIRILCIIPTIQANVDAGIVHVVNVTWARKCTKVMYVLCPREKHPDFIDYCTFAESKAYLLNKMTFALIYAYRHYKDEFDWILKADDDTFIVMENLRFMLSHHDSREPAYMGYHFRFFVLQGYNSGGAGYVLSKQGLKQLVTEGYAKGKCEMDGEVEDMEIGKCLEVG